MTTTKPKTSIARNVCSVVAPVFLAIGTLWCLNDSKVTRLAQTDRATVSSLAAVSSIDASQSHADRSAQYLSKDIRDLQVMQDRVLAENPLDEETESPLGDIDPQQWRIIRLEHTEPDGTRHIIERGMPLDELTKVVEQSDPVFVTASASDIDENWQPGDPLPELFDESGFPIDPVIVAAIMENRTAEPEFIETPLVVGSSVDVDLPEHGISGQFTVTAILPCPTPNPGDGYLVTTKFIHENAEILDLQIEGSSEPIGTTSSHPFWSEDRQQFVVAGDLHVGESLLLADNTPRKVTSLTRRATRETVYNIEVDGEHVFYVGQDGVLVHNSCDDPLPSKPIRIGPRWKAWDVLHPSMRAGCENVATRIQKIIGGIRIHIKPKYGGFLGGIRRAPGDAFKYPRWSDHHAVLRDGRIYDAFTGYSGMPIDEYIRCWEFPDHIDFGF